MSRVIAVAACGAILSACSMSMPSFDSFRSSPVTEVLRIESEPPGADARTAEGQSCRTPCELTVPATTEVAVTFALQGYNPQTINVRAEAPTAAADAQGAPPTRLQPNPVYAELTPTTPARQRKKSLSKKVVKKSTPVTAGTAAAPAPAAAAPVPKSAAPKAPPASTAEPATSNYPWPPPPPPPKQ